MAGDAARAPEPSRRPLAAGADHRGGPRPRAVQTLAREFDERPRRLRWRPEVPAVDGAGVPAPARRTRGGCSARTLEAMARGGIYDQLGGGFARYSVDRAWVVPHFEKMLYDNALLLGVYAAWRDRRRRPGRAEETADFLLASCGTAEGGFASALDADSEGVEGKFYVWTPAQLVEVLGPEDGALGGAALRVTEAGTFEHGASTLQLRAGPRRTSAPAGRRPRRLLDARAGRVRPARDDKVVAAWNGLAIPGSATPGCGSASRRTSTPPVAAGELLAGCTSSTAGCGGSRGTAWSAARRRCSRTTAASRPASSSLLQATGDAVWLERARVAARRRARAVPRRRRRLLRHRATTPRRWSPGRATRRQRVSRPGSRRWSTRWSTYAALTGVGPLPPGRRGGAGDRRHPGRAGAAVRRLVAGGRADDARRAARGRGRRPGGTGAETRRARRRPGAHPGAVVVVADGPRDDIPLLSGRTPVDGRPAAYVCRGLVCERPVDATPRRPGLSRRMSVRTSGAGYVRANVPACRTANGAGHLRLRHRRRRQRRRGARRAADRGPGTSRAAARGRRRGGRRRGHDPGGVPDACSRPGGTGTTRPPSRSSCTAGAPTGRG